MGSVRPRTKGFTLIELMIAVAIIGILSSVAIPAYLKYIYRSRTIEATMNLRAMYDGAVSYYVADHVDANGIVLPKQFPVNAGPTPPAIPGANKHMPTVAEWKSPGWMALDFQISDPYQYQYTFINTGAAPNQVATLRAQGDLDGDNFPSLFQRHATGNHDQIQGDPGLYSQNETE